MKRLGFKYKIGQAIKDSKRDLIIIDREFRKDKNGWNKKYYKYYCNKCSVELWMIESSILNGIGCACCANQVVVKGINDIATTHPKLVKYFVNKEDTYKYTIGSGKKVLMKCPHCGNEKLQYINILNKNGLACNKCNDGISYPNKLMFNLLKQLNIEFESEKRFDWCKFYNAYKNKESFGVYDFYIPSKNLIIEMDGGFHNQDNSMNGQTAKESKEIDNYKDKLANKYGLKVIRIDCSYDNEDRFTYIRNNILYSELLEIFNLNNINWVKIGQDSEKSLVKEVCEYWHLHNDINHEGLTTTDLAKIFNRNRTTIPIWLKRGNSLGWCNYIAKEELIRTNIIKSKNATKLSSKKIEIFKDKISLGVFPSCHELDRESEKVFGVKLDFRRISRVARGEKKTYKGFEFKYI